MLVQLSDVFGEIASSQEILADSLTQSLGDIFKWKK
jgi:hypothetical protein